MIKSHNICFEHGNSHFVIVKSCFELVKSHFDIVFCTKNLILTSLSVFKMTVKHYKMITYEWMNLEWEILYKVYWNLDWSCTSSFISSKFSLNGEKHTGAVQNLMRAKQEFSAPFNWAEQRGWYFQFCPWYLWD